MSEEVLTGSGAQDLLSRLQETQDRLAAFEKALRDAQSESSAARSLDLRGILDALQRIALEEGQAGYFDRLLEEVAQMGRGAVLFLTDGAVWSVYRGEGVAPETWRHLEIRSDEDPVAQAAHRRELLLVDLSRPVPKWLESLDAGSTALCLPILFGEDTPAVLVALVDDRALCDSIELLTKITLLLIQNQHLSASAAGAVRGEQLWPHLQLEKPVIVGDFPRAEAPVSETEDADVERDVPSDRETGPPEDESLGVEEVGEAESPPALEEVEETESEESLREETEADQVFPEELEEEELSQEELEEEELSREEGEEEEFSREEGEEEVFRDEAKGEEEVKEEEGDRQVEEPDQDTRPIELGPGEWGIEGDSEEPKEEGEEIGSIDLEIEGEEEEGEGEIYEIGALSDLDPSELGLSEEEFSELMGQASRKWEPDSESLVGSDEETKEAREIVQAYEDAEESFEEESFEEEDKKEKEEEEEEERFDEESVEELEPESADDAPPLASEGEDKTTDGDEEPVQESEAEESDERAQEDPEAQELHDEAKRFARLLIAEIKLYNEEAVEEGRGQKDLYSRLEEDIARSRQMYEKRVHESVKESKDYFHEELVRVIADGQEELLGEDYPGTELRQTDQA